MGNSESDSETNSHNDQKSRDNRQHNNQQRDNQQCDHQQFNQTLIDKLSGNFSWEFVMYNCKCNDCPEKWILQVTIGKEQNFKNKQNKKSKDKDKHKDTDKDKYNDKCSWEHLYHNCIIDTSNLKVKYKDNERIYIAKCTCRKCKFEFLVGTIPKISYDDKKCIFILNDWSPIMTKDGNYESIEKYFS